MKRITRLAAGVLLLVTAGHLYAQQTITVKGHVKFPDTRFKMEISQRKGFDKIVIDSAQVSEDGTYTFKLPVKQAGVYYLDCQKWQGVSFWGEDEDLQIDFRGMDTARIKIKNPPYVYIDGGKKNEVMNLMNWESYRNYQQMIGISQTVYRLQNMDEQTKQKLSGNLYSLLGNEFTARMKYLAEHYADRSSVLAILPLLKEEPETVESVIRQLEAKYPNYEPLMRFKQDREENLAQQARLAEGQIAPSFSYPTPDGKKQLGPQDFKGKILVLDFWASWCGPCRKEIPALKEAYIRYQAQGVEFLSVSIDKDYSDWQKALKEEAMPWLQVQAPKAGTDVMKLYQFSGIPYILVIDKEGRIKGKNLRGRALTEKIQELLDGKEVVKKSIALPAMGM